MAQSQNVLITGAAGGVGKAVVRALAARGHRVTGLDRLASPDVDHSIEADILDRDAVAEAARGQDAIIHLAATPDEADFVDALLEPNVRGLYHVADAARANGVGKLVLASSVQVVTGHALGGGLGRATTLADGPKVINHYALTKLWLEDLGDMYARVYGLAVIACRLGWLPRSPSHAEELAAASGFDVYLSHRDAGRFFTACIETPMDPHDFEIVFATSRPQKHYRVDPAPARELLGFEGEDTWPDGFSFD